jgi:lysophospholipid acyltransferase (LPLAT)-like uncharacterized protein
MKAALLTLLGTTYLRLIGATSRIIWVNRAVRDHLEATKRGFIYAFWHGRQLFLAYLHQGDRIRPLVSQSRDGELIAQICRTFGIEAIRGSSSRRGVGAALEVQRALASGDRVGFTPDGPRGPLYQIQPGVLFAAQKAGVPIVPVAFGAKRRWVFGSWDRFVVPKPFNRIAMVYGEPVTVAPSDDLNERAEALRLALNQVTRQADEVVGVQP